MKIDNLFCQELRKIIKNEKKGENQRFFSKMRKKLKIGELSQ